MQIWTRLAGVVLWTGLCLLISAPALAQGDQRQRTPAPNAESSNTIRDLERVKALVNEQAKDIDRLWVGLATVFAVGGLGITALTFLEQRRAAGAYRLAIAGESAAQSRATEAHDRFMQASGLVLRGETSSQARTQAVHEALFEESQKTLTLVNETLALAKEASRQATKASEDKTRGLLEDIENQAEEALRKLFNTNDFKAAAEDPEVSAAILDGNLELERIASHISVGEIDLPAVCLFVRGMASHMEDHPRLITRWI